MIEQYLEFIVSDASALMISLVVYGRLQRTVPIIVNDLYGRIDDDLGRGRLIAVMLYSHSPGRVGSA